MAVTVSGMFGNGRTYFADSPVIIIISGLEWPANSPFTVVRVEVRYAGSKAGEFLADTGGQTSIEFDISSALRAIWSDYGFSAEVAAANAATEGPLRQYRSYSLYVHTEYITSDGVYTTTSSGEIAGGRCAVGGLTEWERSNIGTREDADVSHLEFTNPRNGDASTKPVSSPERVGSESITSWVDVQGTGTRSVFYAAGTRMEEDATTAHAPLVLRDSVPYTDFLFVNRRGAVETCSGQTLEAMEIDVETTQYTRVERPAFKPTASLMAVSKGGRRSWSMSSGHQRREWAEWWTMEFLMARRWWMLYDLPGGGKAYVPVTVEPAKKQTGIYDRAKQQMASVDFTVTLALEG